MYWQVTPDISAAVELLVEAGQVEYELSLARGVAGLFTGPELQVVPVTAGTSAGAPGRKYGRR